MPDEFNPYRQWLGFGEDRAPTYYELLGVSPAETDAPRIAVAAERARTKVRSFRPGPQARAWSQLLDEIQAAKECLSDPAKRAAYDAGQVQGSIRAVSATSAAGSDLFPSGVMQPATDLPAQSFQSSAATVESAPAYPMAVPIGPAGAPTAISKAAIDAPLLDPMTPLESEVILPPGADHQVAALGELPAAYAPYGTPVSAADTFVAGVTPTADHAVAVSTAPTASLIASQRDRQAGRGLALFIVAALSLASGVGATFFVLSKSKPSRGQQVIGAAPPTAASQQPASQPAATAKYAKPAAAAAPASTQSIAAESPPTMPSAVQPPSPAERAPTAAAAPNPAPAPATAPAPAPNPPQGPRVTLDQIQSLIKSLETAKVAIAEHNFALADAELAKAQSLAILPKHKEAVARLKEVGGFVKQFREAIAAAVAGMKGGETFKVGTSTQVAFVEGLSDKVILRISGMNRTYPFSDMPPGLALAIADFKLPQSNPATRVVKGAYLLLHKRADGETQEKGQALWQEAEAAGANVGHVMPFLTDNYADFLKDVSIAAQ